jgi:hypothetical protein
VERDPEDFNIDQVTISLSCQPEVVCENNTCDEVNEIMSSEGNHQSEIEHHCNKAKDCEFFPSMSLVFTEANYTTPDMPRKEEVICSSIRHRNRINTGEVPKVALGVSH